MSFSNSLIKFIQENLIQDDKTSVLEEDTPLIESGILDSMGVLQIMTFIEEETGLRVPDIEVKMENFQTVSSIESMIQQLAGKSKDYGGAKS